MLLMLTNDWKEGGGAGGFIWRGMTSLFPVIFKQPLAILDFMIMSFKINDQKITRYPLKLVKILTKAKWGNHTARKLIFLSWKNWNIKYLKNMAAKIRLQWNILTPINWLLDLLINYMVNQIISTFLGNSSKMVSNAMLQCF